MTRRGREVGFIKTCVLGAALVAGSTATAYADNKFELSGSASFTTDYMFRSVSNSNNEPAVQPYMNLGYGIFYANIWGSNTAFGNNIEIDYGGGIQPEWKNITFDISGLAYTYPGANDIDYFELKTGAGWDKGAWSIELYNYWSPNYSQLGTQSDALEANLTYKFNGKLFNFFSPSIVATIGEQWYQDEKIVPSYTYWNVGLSVDFMDHWSAEIRYYDTDYSKAECFIASDNRNACDARAVGTITASF